MKKWFVIDLQTVLNIIFSKNQHPDPFPTLNTS